MLPPNRICPEGMHWGVGGRDFSECESRETVPLSMYCIGRGGGVGRSEFSNLKTQGSQSRSFSLHFRKNARLLLPFRSVSVLPWKQRGGKYYSDMRQNILAYSEFGQKLGSKENSAYIFQDLAVSPKTAWVIQNALRTNVSSDRAAAAAAARPEILDFLLLLRPMGMPLRLSACVAEEQKSQLFLAAAGEGGEDVFAGGEEEDPDIREIIVEKYCRGRGEK